MSSPTPDASGHHPFFPSGDWEGFYSYKANRRPKGEMAMTLYFSNGVIRGAGSDPVGAHAWAGTYDARAETCQLTKTYVGAHSVVYTGYADENGIWGNWKLGWMRGDFHIWPKKSGSQGEEILDSCVTVNTDVHLICN